MHTIHPRPSSARRYNNPDEWFRAVPLALKNSGLLRYTSDSSLRDWNQGDHALTNLKDFASPVMAQKRGVAQEAGGVRIPSDLKGPEAV